MNSKRLFSIGYVLLFASFGLSIVVFVMSPTTVFSLPKDIRPDFLLTAVDSVPTLVFFVGVGFLLAGQLKQRSERIEEL
jgi:hypothetical protein